MGEKLLEFYKEVEELGGLKAKMRLALLTGVASLAAEDLPDSPENIKKFEEAVEKIKKEQS